MERELDEETVGYLLKAIGLPIDGDRIAEVAAVFNQIFTLGIEVMSADVETFEPEARFDAAWQEQGAAS